MKVHPAAELFPVLGEAELLALAEDIKEHGLREPIVLWEDHERETVLLDGRNRLAACELVDVAVSTEFYVGDDPTAYAISKNAIRRHLTKGQAAAIAVAGAPLVAEDAKRRQGTRTDLSPDIIQNSGEGLLPYERTTDHKVGKAVKISAWTVQAYRRVEKDDPALAAQVRAGTISVSSALKVVQGAAAKPKQTRATVEERIKQIRSLAEQGYRLNQIAEKLGLGPARVGVLAKQNDIALPLAKFNYAIDPNHVVEEVVRDLEASVTAIGRINGSFAQLDRTQLDHWVTSLDSSLPHMRTFRKDLNHLKEVTLGQE